MYYCKDIEEAREHAFAGDCAAVDLGVSRRKNDLEQHRMIVMGRPSPEYFRHRIEAERADAEREYSQPARTQRRQGR